MKTIIVEIRLPAADQSFDVRFPLDALFGEVAKLSAEALSTLSDVTFLRTAEPMLCSAEDGIPFPPNRLVADSNIQNGTKMILF